MFFINMEAHIRVHINFVSQANLVSWLDKYCSKVFLVKEIEASREHYQAFVRFDVRYSNLESLRNSLKRILTEKGNRVYSISLSRESNLRHIAYLMKELHGSPPILNKNISVFELKSAQELVDDYARRQKMSSIEKLADSYSGTSDHNSICKYIMDETKKQGRMLPDPRLMKRYIVSIQFIKWPEEFSRVYQAEVANLFSQY